MPRVGWMALFFLIATTWLLGGGFEWGSYWVGFGGLACLAVALWDGRCIRGRFECPLRLVPWLIWLVMVAISIGNPSHLPVGGEPMRVDGANYEAMRAFVPVEHHHWLPRTTYPERTLRYGFASAGVFGLAIALAATRWRRSEIRHFFALVFANVVVLSFVGAWFHYVDPLKAFGRFPTEGGVAFASFHYKNYWAAYAILALGGAMGLGHFVWNRSEGLLPKSNPMVPIALVAVWIPFTFVLCESRAGILITVLLMGWLLVRLVWGMRSLRRKGFPLGVTRGVSVGIGLGLIAWFATVGGRVHVEEMWKESRDQIVGDKGSGRLVAIRDTIAMAKAKPWFGWGYASFSQVYPLFQGPEMFVRKTTVDGEVAWHPRYFEFAHCDWLQLWAETGLIGWVMFMATPLWWLVHCWRLGRSNGISHWVGVGCVLVLLLAWFEFPFGSEAVALLFVSCAVLGGVYALLEEKAVRSPRIS